MKSPGFAILSLASLLLACSDPQESNLHSGAADAEDEEQRIRTVMAEESEHSREWYRDRVSRAYLDMEEEIGIDKETRERLIDILTDSHIYQLSPATRGSLHSDKLQEARAEANAITTELTAIHELLAEEGLDRFHIYMTSGNERYAVDLLDRNLPADDKLSSDQEEQLKELFSLHRRKLNATTSAGTWVGFSSSDFSDEERALIDSLSSLEYREAWLRNEQVQDTNLETLAAAFLSSKQLAVLRQVNEKRRSSNREALERDRPALDAAKVNVLRERVAQAPRERPRQPMPGNIEVELRVTIDDQEPIVATRLLKNSTAISIDAGEISLEVTATLYEPGYADMEVAYFSQIAQKRRELERFGSFGQSLGYTPLRPSTVETTEVVRGRKKGYVIKTEARVSKV